ncbi:uncharacterized protein V6R79_009608 [Siganus canaliculatus]
MQLSDEYTTITSTDRPSNTSAFPVCLSCGDFNYRVEEEASVIYSSVVIKGPVSTTSRTNSTHCVYSEVKHYHDKEKKENI